MNHGTHRGSTSARRTIHETPGKPYCGTIVYQFETAFGYKIPQQQSLGKPVHGHLAPHRSRGPEMQLLKHCLPSPQAEPTMERLESMAFSAASTFWHGNGGGIMHVTMYVNSVCVCLCVHANVCARAHVCVILYLTQHIPLFWST